MALAFLLAAVSTALGVWLGLWPGRTAVRLRRAQGIALGVAAAIVLGTLLPEAAEELGPWAWGVFAAALALPWLLERALGHAPQIEALGTELTYGGLLVHKLADGLALAAYSGSAGLALRGEVLLAIVLHSVPVTALVVLTFARDRGTRAALLRAAGLLLATGLGLVAAAAGGGGWLAPIEPWLGAAVAGLLLHVAFHGHPRHDHDHAPGHEPARGPGPV